MRARVRLPELFFLSGFFLLALDVCILIVVVFTSFLMLTATYYRFTDSSVITLH